MADPHVGDGGSGVGRDVEKLEVRNLGEEDAPEEVGGEALTSPMILVTRREEEATVDHDPAEQTIMTDRIVAEQKELIDPPALDDGMADRIESQSLRLEPWADGRQTNQARTSGLKAGSLKFNDGSISLQFNPQTLLHILQSFSQSDNNDHSFSRKTTPNTTTYHISRTSSYKTRPLPPSLQAAYTANRNTSKPYPISSKSQPLALAFPKLKAGDPSTSEDTLMKDTIPPFQPRRLVPTETHPRKVGKDRQFQWLICLRDDKLLMAQRFWMRLVSRHEDPQVWKTVPLVFIFLILPMMNLQVAWDSL